MLDTKQFLSAVNQIAEEKGIAKEKVIETIEMAIAAAYKKDYGEKGQIIRAKMDPHTNAITMHQVKVVVDESMLKTEEDIAREAAEDYQEPQVQIIEGEEQVKKVTFNPERHIMQGEAQKIKPDAAVNDEIMFDLEAYEDFGRIAAQTAKQVIIQRLREAEREMVLSEYKSKEGEAVNAQVQRLEWRNIIFDLGKTSGVMYFEDQIPGERYRIGDRLKVYIVKVEMTSKGPMVVLSRSHPSLVKKLFEMEVPEIATGVVEIKAIAREAGSRTKIAVATTQDSVDPIGSCVGQKGTRVGTVISEINGEKIDIIEWSSDPAVLISNALSPAKVVSVEIKEETKESKVIVPNDQLSLAIGRGGQNVRLAARLSGWKIDVQSLTPAPVEAETPAVETSEAEDGAAQTAEHASEQEATEEK
ncbi:hypothetical protein A3C91_04315 [Candidatus Azambacteria bacterium RIFCSPHIGHO2_02_FULL_52_12]|uniref:Transcription termination/antitermination protein NusA n=1 Tax=Candidatus Azambacteria bacterium RIFCSPLOWO2_01_FULL_46_25 TaxID=1797298 RepID=A0A1F5BUB7_9BACT|nr:MAG: hypothetical protein A3C91_04315 [Candidatus Azambacteria bacterium RIFCSPHIGHO2_02_FULL_52_12]OGD34201.1 MAG: hypothetical protein A2988_01865 [Candidatus Azambacteria bacterium RIFCSPLOWO2_01_FULL_46_25]OGD36877.1 MAG: hypothetical protein A2850_00945 [Candidatus Azambacteria bacterium RIFCSPHIGHO2_01_FULL_51_74]